MGGESRRACLLSSPSPGVYTMCYFRPLSLTPALGRVDGSERASGVKHCLSCWEPWSGMAISPGRNSCASCPSLPFLISRSAHPSVMDQWCHREPGQGQRLSSGGAASRGQEGTTMGPWLTVRPPGLRVLPFSGKAGIVIAGSEPFVIVSHRPSLTRRARSAYLSMILQSLLLCGRCSQATTL